MATGSRAQPADPARKQESRKERGKDYNHSTYCDLIINGLIGLRPREDETVEVNPLVPAGTWDYFCLDQVRYHGRWLTILYDKNGDRYHKGAGMRVFADGKEIAHAPRRSARFSQNSRRSAARWASAHLHPKAG